MTREDLAAEEELDFGEEQDQAVEQPVRRRRATRKRLGPRAKVLSTRITRTELRLGAELYPADEVVERRPATRGECEEGQRPCPWVSCAHHLYLDVSPESGSIKINFPDLEPWDLAETCTLDVADRAGITLEEVGEIMNLTRERIRQVEVKGLLKLKMASPSPEEFGALSIPRGKSQRQCHRCLGLGHDKRTCKEPEPK